MGLFDELRKLNQDTSIFNLNEDVEAEFLGNVVALNEDLDLFDDDYNLINESNYIMLDSATKRKRLLRQATLLAAKENQDPLYLKYVSVSRRRRSLREKIQQKYASKGRQKLAEFEAAKRNRE